MSQWPATKTGKVYRALIRRGWFVVSDAGGSHRRLRHPNYPDAFTWAFHEGVEIGPAMLSRIAKRTGLTPADL